MEYKWKKENIDTSSFNDELKEIVNNELNNNVNEQDPSYIKVLSFKDFKKDYKRIIKALKNYDKSIYSLLKLTPKLFPYIINKRYTFPPQNFTPDILIDIETTFIEYLDDIDLLETYKKLIQEDKHLINIENSKDYNNISNLVNGRTISNGEDVYMSFYMKDSIEDLSILTHEFGHMFARCLFKNKDSIFNILLTETESIYMELLMDDYIGKKLDEKELQNMLISNRCLKCIEDIWIFKIKNIAYKLPIYNENIINKITKDNVKLTKEDKDIILNDENLNVIKRILSTLFAFTLYEKTLENKEEGIKLYKSLLSSDEKDINQLLRNNNITYSNLIINFCKHLNNSHELSNIKKR